MKIFEREKKIDWRDRALVFNFHRNVDEVEHYVTGRSCEEKGIQRDWDSVNKQKIRVFWFFPTDVPSTLEGKAKSKVPISKRIPEDNIIELPKGHSGGSDNVSMIFLFQEPISVITEQLENPIIKIFIGMNETIKHYKKMIDVKERRILELQKEREEEIKLKKKREQLKEVKNVKEDMLEKL